MDIHHRVDVQGQPYILINDGSMSFITRNTDIDSALTSWRAIYEVEPTQPITHTYAYEDDRGNDLGISTGFSPSNDTSPDNDDDDQPQTFPDDAMTDDEFWEAEAEDVSPEYLKRSLSASHPNNTCILPSDHTGECVN